MLEGAFKRVVKRELDKRGILWFNVIQGQRGTTKGISDILGVIPRKIGNEVYGLFCAVEVKRDDGKGVLSAHQERFLDEVKKNGGLAFVIDSRDELAIVLATIDNLLDGGSV